MEVSSQQILFAFLLTLIAGLSTGIGSLLAFFTQRTHVRFLAFALGFSAGVMIYISFSELYVDAKDSLINAFGELLGQTYAMGLFFLGIILTALIDKCVPSYENPHEMHDVEEMQEKNIDPRLLRMGIFSAIAIAIHNFPEGLATFMSALEDPALGVSICFAIAIHNIPEGIAVSVPVFYATGNAKKAFFYSFLSGLAEPLGGLLGYFMLSFLWSHLIVGMVFAFIAGVMVFISFDQLLPTAEKYGEHHIVIYGLICGMFFIATGLLLFI
jgi:zinc transporter, ZIP family